MELQPEEAQNETLVMPPTSPQKPQRTEAYPSISETFALIPISILFTILFLVLLLPIQKATGGDNSALKGFFDALVYALSLLGCLLFAKWMQSHTAPKEGTFRFEIIDWRIYPVLLILPIALQIILSPLIDLIPGKEWLEEIFRKDIMGDAFWGAVTIVVLAPIIEELLFRGIVLDGFLHRYSPKKSIIWSALLFGFFHLNPWQFVFASTIGVVLGWMYWKTRSLLPGIFLHFTNNGFGLVSDWLFPSDSKDKISEENFATAEFLYLFVGAAIVLLICGWLIDKIFEQRDRENLSLS